MDRISKLDFKAIDEQDKEIILNSLGLRVTGDDSVVDNAGDIQCCQMSGEPLRFSNLSIAPGSLILMNTNENTISAYYSHLERESG